MRIETIEEARSIRREILDRVNAAWRAACRPEHSGWALEAQLGKGKLASRASEVVKHDRFLKTGRTYR